MSPRQTAAIVQHAQAWAEARARRLAIGRELRQRQQSPGDWMRDRIAIDLSRALSHARRDEQRATRALAKLFAPTVIKGTARPLQAPAIAMEPPNCEVVP